jgi:hypothetical protein
MWGGERKNGVQHKSPLLYACVMCLCLSYAILVVCVGCRKFGYAHGGDGRGNFVFRVTGTLPTTPTGLYNGTQVQGCIAYNLHVCK